MEIDQSQQGGSKPSHSNIRTFDYVDSSEENGKRRKQKHGETQIDSLNNRTLTDINSDYETDCNKFIHNFFKKLSFLHQYPDNLNKLFYDKSCFTMILSGQSHQVLGESQIIHFLKGYSHLNQFNIEKQEYQPGLGKGASMVILGTVNNVRFMMNINIVKMRKHHYIQNIFYQIDI